MQDWNAENPELVNPENQPLEITEFCRVCRLDQEVLTEWVAEGVVEPVPDSRTHWRFSARQVRRAKTARRLQRDLELDTAGLPLILDLLEEVQSLRRELAILKRHFE